MSLKKYAIAAPCFLLLFGTIQVNLSAQNVGIGVAAPISKLHVQTAVQPDGIRIENTAADGDPILQFTLNGTNTLTMGVDDSDADKFKIGTTAITTNTRITIETGGNIGIRTTTPANMLHMTNGGVTVGATAMAEFENLSVSGVSLAGTNNNTTSGYNAIEGITYYNGTAFIPAGVLGLAIYNGAASAPTIGVRGATNEWQGTGVRGSRFNGGGANTGWGGEFYDDLGYTGFLGTISDARTKKNIRPIQSATQIISQLSPVMYQYDTDKYPTMGLSRTEEFGFIAQDVASVLPNITRTKTFSTNACEPAAANGQIENKTEEFVVMDYTRLIPILTQAAKEQQAVIDEMQKTIEALKAEIEELKN